MQYPGVFICRSAVPFHLGSLILLLCCIACRNTSEKIPSVYQQEIEDWRRQRVAALMAPDSWLALSGLYWLEFGENTFGSDSSNHHVFPAKAPAFMGSFHRYADSVVMHLSPELPALFQDSAIIRFKLSGRSSPPLIHHGDLSWVPIQRGDRYGIRLWDRQHPKLQDTVQIDYFPINPAWRIPAKWSDNTTTDTLIMRNVLGMELPMAVAGALQFDHAGVSYRLWALDGGEDELFLIFADATTGNSTYSGGRYLYTSRPDSTGVTYIDFNKAYNPPCAFTDYATCLLPPAENRLDGLAIEAGEKSYGDH